MNNTKLKELGLWIEPTDSCLAIRADKKRLHRLFNPHHDCEEITEEIEIIREERKRIRKFKHDNLILARKIVNDPKFKLKIKKSKRSNHKLKTRKVRKALSMFLLENKKPSMFKNNNSILISHGYIPKKSNAKRQRIKKQEERIYIKSCRHQKDNPLNFRQRRAKNRKQNKLDKLNKAS